MIPYERQPQIILQHDPDHAQRRAPQLIRIARPRRLLADRPEAHQRVELVGQRHGNRHRVAVGRLRHRVGRPLRLVVQLDGARDLGLGADGLRVVAAHQPLQLGELAHHARHQVGLGQLRRAPRILGFGIHRAGDLERQLGDPLHPLLLAAQLLVEGDAAQRHRHLVERLLQVLLPEELGVRQARADHLLVAGDDLLAAVLAMQVGHQQELVGELARARMLAARSTSGAASSTASGTRPAPPGTPRRSCPSARWATR